MLGTYLEKADTMSHTNPARMDSMVWLLHDTLKVRLSALNIPIAGCQNGESLGEDKDGGALRRCHAREDGFLSSVPAFSAESQLKYWQARPLVSLSTSGRFYFRSASYSPLN
jgi:hypothetical protein